MPQKNTPLSPTVASVFEAFLKKLESQMTLGAEAIEALRQAVDEQRLDPESLRKAVFTPSDPKQ
jgi:uncharacterized coiled-coil protein SlyX